jgi:hypothetical protein
LVKKIEREPQNLAMAVGSAFDSLLTAAIAREIGLDHQAEYHLDNLLKASVTYINPDEALEMANRLFKTYVKLGCLSNLLDEGVTQLHGIDEETIADGEEREVRLHGRIDIGLHDGTVIDAKVNGAIGSGQYPKKGYARCIVNDGTYKTEHKNFGLPLEDIDFRWGVQLSVYTWLKRGLLPFRPVRVGIEQVAVKQNRIAIASFRTYISEEFQRALWQNITHAWQSIQEGNIPEAQPSNQRCMAFRKLCPAAEHCEAYQNWQNEEPELKDLMGI